MANMIEVLKQALEALEQVTKELLAVRDELAERGARPTTNVFHQRLWDSSFSAYTDHAIPAAQSLRKAIKELESQEPVACDGDFPEGFDKSLGIPAQALREANAALCEVTNNRMWDVPALAERMLLFCRNTHPQPKREPLTDEQIKEIWKRWPHQVISGAIKATSFARAIEAAHGIKEES